MYFKENISSYQYKNGTSRVSVQYTLIENFIHLLKVYFITGSAILKA